jgi:phosphopentomutase
MAQTRDGARRVVLIVLDGVGCGAAPDAAAYGDEGANSLANTARAVGGLHLPHMERLGLGYVTEIMGVSPDPEPTGVYGRLQEASAGKDTVTGHWEMMGIISEQPQPTYPHGFPPDVIATFERISGCGALGNKPASGTEIIKELGDEHMRTGKPIVYTSADSVFQVAAHESVIPLPELYRICEEMRAALTGPHAVGRVIARPFVGESGHYARDNEGRRDWALLPPRETALDVIAAASIPVRGVGKIADIFAGRGITSNDHALNNEGAIAETLRLLQSPERSLVFSNLIEFDMVYGHRKDPQGYAGALVHFDEVLPDMLNLLGPEDAIFITGDHGVDPSDRVRHTDHTREYVPLLGYGYRLPAGTDIGTRPTFADLGATILDLFGLPPLQAGTTFAAADHRRS